MRKYFVHSNGTVDIGEEGENGFLDSVIEGIK